MYAEPKAEQWKNQVAPRIYLDTRMDRFSAATHPYEV
jgi:hypothetical protein